VSLELDARDLAALLFTWQNRFVSGAQLRRAFWRDRTPAQAALRLDALHAAAFLNARDFPWLKEQRLYFAGPTGNRALAGCGLLAPSQVKDYPRRPEHLSPALRHDLAVVDLRLGLEESGADGRSWISDHELRTQQRREGAQERVPDALFDFRREGRPGKGVLEYEHAPYRSAFIPSLLARVRDRYDGYCLFFVAPTLPRADSLRTWALNSGIYDDVPRQAAFSHAQAVSKDGLNGGFVDLLGRPWAWGKSGRG
jgi:Replication-relaxation